MARTPKARRAGSSASASASYVPGQDDPSKNDDSVQPSSSNADFLAQATDEQMALLLTTMLTAKIPTFVASSSPRIPCTTGTQLPTGSTPKLSDLQRSARAPGSSKPGRKSFCLQCPLKSLKYFALRRSGLERVPWPTIQSPT